MYGAPASKNALPQNPARAGDMTSPNSPAHRSPTAPCAAPLDGSTGSGMGGPKAARGAAATAAGVGESRSPLNPAKASSGNPTAQSANADRTATENGRRRKVHVAGKKTELFGSAAIGIP